jgi:hypothetical protein
MLGKVLSNMFKIRDPCGSSTNKSSQSSNRHDSVYEEEKMNPPYQNEDDSSKIKIEWNERSELPHLSHNKCTTTPLRNQKSKGKPIHHFGADRHLSCPDTEL